MDELTTLVLYDIEDDRVRNRVAEVCKDYGLSRIQFSAFSGTLNKLKRRELELRLRSELGGKPGRMLIQPLCEKDARGAVSIENIK